MRERWSKWLAAFTGVVVLALAYTVAACRNPPEERPAAAPESAAEADPASEQQALIAAGRRIYEREACGRCHGAAGSGSPLDDVGDRLTPEETRDWIVAPARMEDQMPRAIFMAKQQYGQLLAGDLDALVAFMQSLRSAPD